MRSQLRRLFSEENGQDLVEYMLLTTLIGIAAVVGVGAFRDAMGFVYASWDTAIQDPAVVEVPDPVVVP